MKSHKLILLCLFILFSFIGIAQNTHKNKFELHIALGLSNTNSELGNFTSDRLPNDLVTTEEKGFDVNRHYGLSITRFFSQHHGLKLHFGRAKFGFRFKGVMGAENIPINETVSGNFLEWGVSYVGRITVSDFLSVLLEPGIRYHSDGFSSSRNLRLSVKDSFSYSGYAGVEIPMMANNFFVSIGAQFKVHAEQYNRTNFDDDPPYNPYFIGLKLGISYQF